MGTRPLSLEPLFWYGGSELLPQGRCGRHLPPVRSAAGAGRGTGSSHPRESWQRLSRPIANSAVLVSAPCCPPATQPGRPSGCSGRVTKWDTGRSPKVVRWGWVAAINRAERQNSQCLTEGGPRWVTLGAAGARGPPHLRAAGCCTSCFRRRAASRDRRPPRRRRQGRGCSVQALLLVGGNGHIAGGVGHAGLRTRTRGAADVGVRPAPRSSPLLCPRPTHRLAAHQLMMGWLELRAQPGNLASRRCCPCAAPRQ